MPTYTFVEIARFNSSLESKKTRKKQGILDKDAEFRKHTIQSIRSNSKTKMHLGMLFILQCPKEKDVNADPTAHATATTTAHLLPEVVTTDVASQE